MINLDRIERRANAATEGPWGFSYGSRRYIADPSTDIVGEVAPPYSGQTMCVFAVASANQGDAEFIASARADVPALIARVRELEAESAKWKEAFERIRSTNTDLMMQLFDAQERTRAINISPVLVENAQLKSMVLKLEAELLKRKP